MLPPSINSASLHEDGHQYRFLALCARSYCNQSHYAQIVQAASEVNHWLEVVNYAETHGLSPLLYTHLQTTGVVLPPSSKQVLQGYFLRHRQANLKRMAILRDILIAFDAVGIKAIVLKGAALAHLVYPQPNLRPMRDVDILVKPSEALQAQKILVDLGFNAPLKNADEIMAQQHHLKAAYLHTKGLTISIEIHHKFFTDNYPGPISVDDLTSTPNAFSLGNGVTAYTLGHEDMLWHICQHMVHNAFVFKSTRLIWIADIVSYAEKFANIIDWEIVRKQYPIILNMLSLLHLTTPLSKDLQNRVSLPLEKTRRGIGRDFQGWPRSTLAMQREKGILLFLRDTFWPSQWWLCLHYGLGIAQPLWWYRWIRHPFRILGLVIRLLRERFKAFFCKKNCLQEKIYD